MSQFQIHTAHNMASHVMHWPTNRRPMATTTLHFMSRKNHTKCCRSSSSSYRPILKEREAAAEEEDELEKLGKRLTLTPERDCNTFTHSVTAAKTGQGKAPPCHHQQEQRVTSYPAKSRHPSNPIQNALHSSVHCELHKCGMGVLLSSKGCLCIF